MSDDIHAPLTYHQNKSATSRAQTPVFDPAVSSAVDDHSLHPDVTPLSPREAQILRLIATGASNQHIAYELGAEVKTIKNHVSIILSKLHCQSRTEAAIRGLTLGFVEPPQKTHCPYCGSRLSVPEAEHSS